MRVTLVAASVAFVALAVVASPAASDPGAAEQQAPPEPSMTGSTTSDESGSTSASERWIGASADDAGITAGAGSVTPVGAGTGTAGGGSSGGGGGPARAVDCLVTELPAEDTPIMPGVRDAVPLASETVEGHRYYQECWYVDTGDIFYANVWTHGPPDQPGVSARALARSALSRVPYTIPAAQMAPAVDGEQITGLPTWLWLDPTSWQSVEAEAGVPGVSVTVTASPTRTVWDMGDGTTVECAGSGVPWDAAGPDSQQTDCSHVYQDVSAGESGGRYEGSVTVMWSVAWEASTGEEGTFPEGSSSSPFSVLVTEMQAVVTYDS